MTSDIDEFIRTIFMSDPQMPNSHILQFDWTTIEDVDSICKKMDFIFKELLYIFTEAMKIRHGTMDGSIVRVDLNAVNSDALYKMNQYFNSFGFIVKCDITSIGDIAPSQVQPKMLEELSDNLSDYFYRLYTTTHMYVISFVSMN
jgi:hypothetical protein